MELNLFFFGIIGFTLLLILLERFEFFFYFRVNCFVHLISLITIFVVDFFSAQYFRKKIEEK